MAKVSTQPDIDPELLMNFLDESEESIATLDELFINLEQQPNNKEIIESIFRVAHSIKGLAAFFKLEEIKDLTHNMENVLDNLRNDMLVANSKIIDGLLSGFDEVSRMLSRIRAGQNQVLDQNRFLKILDTITMLSELTVQKDRQDTSTESDLATAHVEKATRQALKVNDLQSKNLESVTGVQEDEADKVKETKAIARTMRISEEKIDVFMNYVGDLIEISESFNLLQKQFDNNLNRKIAAEFKNINISFNQLSNKLQKSLLNIRKIPAKNLFQKVPRMVRDLSNMFGKRIKVDISGEDIQIDKSMIEALESPINHLIRNCVDHGIETTEKRRKMGKSEVGTIKIDITECGEEILIKVEDDGAGIDIEKIRTKAIQKGLITDNQKATLSHRDILKLIFTSGFSTADEISDISGRGVGMDVVKTKIESLKGSIDLQSTSGQGSIFTISLPSSLTTLVINGLLLSLGDQKYIVRSEDIHEIVRPKPQEIIMVQGHPKYLHIHGRIHPLISLRELFQVETKITEPTESMVILAKSENNTGAILIDTILGQQRVVVKKLDKRFSYLNTIAGTAILGDMRVGLVLDISGILTQFAEQN